MSNTCCICKKQFNYTLHNAEPFHGKCCNKCNSNFVLNVRLALPKYRHILIADTYCSYSKTLDSIISKHQKVSRDDILFVLNATKIRFYEFDKYVAIYEDNDVEEDKLNKAALALIDIKVVGQVLIIEKELLE